MKVYFKCLDMSYTVCAITLLQSNIAPQNAFFVALFLFERWDMLVAWRVPLDGLFDDSQARQVPMACDFLPTWS